MHSLPRADSDGDTILKVIYVAPMKALVRERIQDWKKRLEGGLGKRVVELTGDVTPDMRAVLEAQVSIFMIFSASISEFLLHCMVSHVYSSLLS